MKINKLIQELTKLQKEFGNVQVHVNTLSHGPFELDLFPEIDCGECEEPCFDIDNEKCKKCLSRKVTAIIIRPGEDV